MNKTIQRIHEKGAEKSFKYVGIHLDEMLSFHHHVNHVRNKIMNTAYQLRRQKNNMPRKTKVLIYSGLIRPILEYGINIYGCSTQTTLKSLIILQKKNNSNSCFCKLQCPY